MWEPLNYTNTADHGITNVVFSLNKNLIYYEPNNHTRLSTVNRYLSDIRKAAKIPVPSKSSLWRRLSIFCLQRWSLEWTSPCRLDHCSSSVLLLIKFSPAFLKYGINLDNFLISKEILSLLTGWYIQSNGTCIIVVASRFCRKCIRIKQERNHRCRMMMRRITSLLRVSRSSCLSFSLRNT